MDKMNIMDIMDKMNIMDNMDKMNMIYKMDMIYHKYFKYIIKQIIKQFLIIIYTRNKNKI